MSRFKVGRTSISELLFILKNIANGARKRLAGGKNPDLEWILSEASAAEKELGDAMHRKLAAITELKNATYGLEDVYRRSRDRFYQLRGRLHALYGLRAASDLADFGVRAPARGRPSQKRVVPGDVSIGGGGGDPSASGAV